MIPLLLRMFATQETGFFSNQRMKLGLQLFLSQLAGSHHKLVVFGSVSHPSVLDLMALESILHCNEEADNCPSQSAQTVKGTIQK